MRSHKNLQVWQEAMGLVKEIYEMTRSFPESERFGLISQMRRSAVSVPSNISEGAGRNGNKEFLHFLYIARGSLCELETQVIIGQQLGFIAEPTSITEKIEKIFGLLAGLINSIKSKTI